MTLRFAICLSRHYQPKWENKSKKETTTTTTNPRLTEKWSEVICVSGIDVGTRLQQQKFHHVQVALSCADVSVQRNKAQLNIGYIGMSVSRYGLK